MQDEIRQKISQDFGFGSLPPLEQERMIERVGTLLFESVLDRCFDQLDEATIGEYEKMLADDGAGYDQILSFFKEKVPNFPDIVSEELKRLSTTTSALLA